MKAITHIHNRNVHSNSVNKTPEEDMEVNEVELKTSPDPAAATDATPQLCKRRTPAPSPSPNTSSDDLRPPESEPPAEPATPVKPCDPKGDGPQLDINKEEIRISDDENQVVL